MKPKILLDTGPLVAFLNARDDYHDWAKDELSRLEPPLFTCEAVLSEALFLLRHAPAGPRAVLALVERGLLDVAFSLADDVAAVAHLLRRYGDVPMSLADACLVRMSEQHDDARVLTLDGDFRVYRRHGRKTVRTIMPVS